MNKKSFYPTNQQRKDHFPGLQEKFIGRDALRDLILEELAGRLDDGFDLNRGLYIADYQFYCPPLEDARDIVFGSKIKPMRRNMTRPGKERFDCDDFSLLLKARFAYAAYREAEYRNSAHCFGIAWGLLPYPFPHSLNWLVTADEELYFVEPQTYEFFRPGDRNFRDIYFMLV